MTQLYLDMDGVLADFDKKKHQIFGEGKLQCSDDEFWEYIWDHFPNWFEELEPMPDMDLLWGYTKPLKPILLTACTKSNTYETVRQKQAWARKWLGPDVPVICCMRSHKKDYAVRDGKAILIDDHADNVKQFQHHGGVGILHKSAALSIAALVDLL